MATFRIALVLVCLTAVGATVTCADGADTETCSQLDSASLIQLQPSVVKADELNFKAASAHVKAIGGLAQVDKLIKCEDCMDLLEACVESLTGGSDGDTKGNTGTKLPGDAIAMVGAGIPDMPDDPCGKFNKAITGKNGGNYKHVLCIMGRGECGGGEDVLNAPKECYYQLMAKAMPDFEEICPENKDGNNNDFSLPTFTQQEATRKLKGDVSRACTNPNKDNPADWACPCLGDMREACGTADDEQACFKCLMCQDPRICKDWKTGNCAGTPSDCSSALLVETNTSMKARAKEARVKEDTPSQALDESLTGKCPNN